MQFLDVKTDFAFKKVFGSEQSKDILIDFLNAILDFEDTEVTDLTIVDPYQIPLLKGRTGSVDKDEPMVYICENYTCKIPVTDVESLKEALSD